MIELHENIPDSVVATIDDNGEIATHRTHDLFNYGRYVLVGVPGAFTPVCTYEHLPELIANAPSIIAQDISAIYCISDDNPWALKEWRQYFPGQDYVNFLSDGNREFLAATGLYNNDRDMFVASHYSRFFAIIDNLVLKSLNIEDHVRDMTCSAGQAPDAYFV
jgi:peroxiredoxin